MAEIPNKDGLHVRFLTFNVNGLRTFFHFHPFRDMNNSLAKAFDYFKSDIITFQELKTDPQSITTWGKTRGFYSFISIPVKRKGYSGVGCWVRIPNSEDPLFEILQVVKAEEGITGYLSIKIGKSSVRYRDDKALGIGGYQSLGLQNESEALALDAEGRCVMVELKCNAVIISTYCPANSSQSDEGEEFRLKFLKVLFRRIRNLQAVGKTVVLMGDINVCRDLIDHAEALKESHIMVTNLTKGSRVEVENAQSVREFIYSPSRPARRLLNEMLADSKIPQMAASGTLVDTTRQLQGEDRLKMYTVWSTLKNARPINFGSRIDYILVSAHAKDFVKRADIWPEIMGSDHCPVFADLEFQVPVDNNPKHLKTSLPFEAKQRYSLNHRDILSMFPRSPRVRIAESKSDTKQGLIQKPVSNSKKTQSFCVAKLPNAIDFQDGNEVKSHPDALHTQESSLAQKSDSFFHMLHGMLDKPPQCKHGENSILRTSKTESNPGKKFWVCARPKGEPNDKEASCGYFQWKS
ncbi:LANO_0F04324g1_1 [Lachancea nothofagi CBS 11611]|uniref:DNA-(apurinic or apyrimidinic site) endonuclease 2 n=1 Tax=Lachancea nothofagi CBS 11611 TaxID=1266666 RepID=A0A1G4K7J5_9SACH|nr:LANO_0F04324g1_1 [Lachancea nothofagi CBS 11611]